MGNTQKSAVSAVLKTPMGKKAHDAFYNAKQRCENDKNPSYPLYGKLGVKMLFESFADFLDHIGLPPSKDASLDRIDPDGNYEPGNVRWASKAIQAVNKKGNPLGSQLSLKAQIANAESKKRMRKEREDLAKCWSIFVRAINRGTFTAAEVAYLSKQNLPLDVYDGGWALGQARAFGEEDSYFFLPSITNPGRASLIVGGPLSPSTGDSNGVIPGLSRFFGSAEDIVATPFANADAGVAVIGGKSEEWLKIGGIDGIFMVAASRIGKVRKVSLMPLMLLIDGLRDLGSSYQWPEVLSPILDVGALFVPDFHIDYGEAIQPTHKEWVMLANLIDYRQEHGKRTYLGIQNHNRVPAFILEKLVANYVIRELPEHPVIPKIRRIESMSLTTHKAISFLDVKNEAKKWLKSED